MTKSARVREKQRLREEFANNWSVIGYRYLYFDTGIRKTFWMLLLIAATGLAGFLFYGTIFEFFAYETFVVNNVDYSMEELQFPTVTFCNLNPRVVKEDEKDDNKKGSSSTENRREPSKTVANDVYLQLKPQKIQLKTHRLSTTVGQLSIEKLQPKTTRPSKLSHEEDDFLKNHMVTSSMLRGMNFPGEGTRRKSTSATSSPKLDANAIQSERKKSPTSTTINKTEVLTRWVTQNKVTTFRQAINKFEITYEEMTNNKKTKSIRNEACIFENEICRREDIRDTMSWDYSLCYQFNSFNKRYVPKNSSAAGMNGGLNMFLNIAAKNATQNDFVYDGMALIINPFGIPHMLQEYNDVVLVQPGTMNAITLEVVKTKLLPNPYPTACGKVAYKIITHYPYSKAMCEVDCILQRIVKKCKCVGFEFEGFARNVSICSVQQMKCFYKYRDSYKRKVPRGCRDSCPRECISYRYNIRTTQASIGNNHVYSKMADDDTKSITKEFISENLVGFQISFRGINEHTSIMTPAATWRSLLGEVGGNLGLCMGLSVLTVFELIFFIYDYAWVLLCGCRLKDEPTVEPQVEMQVEMQVQMT